MRRLLILLLGLVLSACRPMVDTTETDDDTTSAPATSTTTESDTGTSTTTTSTPPSGTCSSDLLGWEPNGATDLEPFTGCAAHAASLPPFAVDTACATVLVGLYINEGTCGAPTSLDVFTSAGKGAPTPLTTYALEDAFAVQELTPHAFVYSFHRAQHYPAGARPLVGMATSTACALGGFPACDPERAWHYDGAWSTLVAFSGAEDQLYFGVADCVTEAL